MISGNSEYENAKSSMAKATGELLEEQNINMIFVKVRVKSFGDKRIDQQIRSHSMSSFFL